jgi:hypothetical protein
VINCWPLDQLLDWMRERRVALEGCT